MTTIQLNAELFRELNIVVTDEGMMEKAIKALRRITHSRPALSRSKAAKAQNCKVSLPELPSSLKRLRGMGRITHEDTINDERLAYILSK